jgi:hypothetical protein
MANGEFRRAQSFEADARAAVREFHAGVHQPDCELVMFFCSSNYDLDALADEMNRLFAGTTVIGCTTAGEIGPGGYRAGSLSGVSVPAGSCAAVCGRLEQLQKFRIEAGQDFTATLLHQLEAKAPSATSRNSFGFLLIDGLSIREEPVARTIQNVLGDMAMIGGSAGDDLKFERTQVFHDGAFHIDSAVLALVTTELPFTAFKSQHFQTEEERLIVTEADSEHRVVKEINGLPAAEEYARLTGVPASDLTPSCFASSPVVVVIDGTDYVRSIQRMNEDGSLTFYCAIDEGLVLRVARGGDMLDNLGRALDEARTAVGEPQLTLVSDCILRRLEMMQKGMEPAVEELFKHCNAVGFSTYGEQFRGVHVNQTVTGIAIGR